MYERSLVRALVATLPSGTSAEFLRIPLPPLHAAKRLRGYEFQCNGCGSFQISLRGGEELLLESVTMEDLEP